MANHWPVEDIPDEDSLFVRVHRQWVRADGPSPNNFRNRGRGMSCDWCRYSTPDETRRRAAKPELQAVVSLNAGAVRAIDGQTVVHEPDPDADNRAHSEVFGEKDPETRVKLARIAAWEIELDLE